MQDLDVPQLFVKQLCIVLQVEKKSPLKTMQILIFIMDYIIP